MTRLLLINGAPGAGKSTLAHALAQDRPLTLALDIDVIKHSLGRWDEDPSASGLHARRLSLALAGEQLGAGYDLVIGQYVARTSFIEELERLAHAHAARFLEVVLDLDAHNLARRLSQRAADPDRVEHRINNRLVRPEDAGALTETIEALRTSRPRAVWVDARGSISATLRKLRAAVDEPTP